MAMEQSVVAPIGIIAPDTALLRLALSCLDRSECTVRYGFLAEAARIAPKLVRRGAQVLISRGVTTVSLRDLNLQVPVLDLPMFEFDLLSPLIQAREIDDRVAFFGFPQIQNTARNLAHLLGLRLDSFETTSGRLLRQGLNTASQMGYKVILGNSFTVEHGRKLGMQGFSLLTSEETLRMTVAEARRTLEILTRERQWERSRQSVKGLGRHAVAGAAPGHEGGSLTLNARDVYQRGLTAPRVLDDIVHESPVMRQSVIAARRAALSDAPLLIMGATGTGKELFAQGVHNASFRRHGPFVPVSCGALPEALIESELFGYADGAFTNARKGGKPGLFEMADSGTLFLDEIGELPLPMQAKLLRFMDEQRYMRLGGDRMIRTNVRVISATHRDLPKMAEQGTFRPDLLYRLGMLLLKVPPLPARRQDIPLLVHHFAVRISSRLGLPGPKFSERAMAVLREYDFPGNVRELLCILERAITNARSVLIGEEDVIPHLERQPDVLPTPLQALRTAPRTDLAGILAELERCDGNRRLAARRLGISYTTLWRRLKNRRQSL
jgi:transcriptional regulator with PAS, ATPase and Fis domain